MTSTVSPPLTSPSEASSRSPLRWIVCTPARAFVVLFIPSFALRLWTLTLLPQDIVPPNPDWETGAVAISLVETGTFSDPYLIPTGPTAHMPPLDVAAMSLIYRVL
ncbi:hypothetical protein ACFL5A_03955, partial [Gemmatimonadota bacterium]